MSQHDAHRCIYKILTNRLLTLSVQVHQLDVSILCYPRTFQKQFAHILPPKHLSCASQPSYLAASISCQSRHYILTHHAIVTHNGLGIFHHARTVTHATRSFECCSLHSSGQIILPRLLSAQLFESSFLRSPPAQLFDFSTLRLLSARFLQPFPSVGPPLVYSNRPSSVFSPLRIIIPPLDYLNIPSSSLDPL